MIMKKMASSQSDIVIRMRPDAGIPGINAIRSLNTWKTLRYTPEYTIVQYGTWFKKTQNIVVNGDNCFAAQKKTFHNFITHWQQEFKSIYTNQIKSKFYSPELTMNVVCLRHNITIFESPN
jgi:hypothetical protein